MPQHIMAILHYFEVIQWHTDPIHLFVTFCLLVNLPCQPGSAPSPGLQAGIDADHVEADLLSTFPKLIRFQSVCLRSCWMKSFPRTVSPAKNYRLLTNMDTEVGWRCTWFPLIFLSPLIKHTSLLTKHVNYYRCPVVPCMQKLFYFYFFYCKKTVNYCGNCLTVCKKTKKRMFAGSHLWLSQGTIFIFAIVFQSMSSLLQNKKKLLVWGEQQ